MPLDVGMRYYRPWVGDGGVLQAPPLEMQQISPVCSRWGTGRAGDVLCIGRLVRTRVTQTPPPPPPGSTVPHWHQKRHLKATSNSWKHCVLPYSPNEHDILGPQKTAPRPFLSVRQAAARRRLNRCATRRASERSSTMHKRTSDV